MTLLDMIDLLEHQIEFLRARVAATENSTNPVAQAASKRMRGAKKARKKTASNKGAAKRKQSKSANQQLLLPPTADTPPSPTEETRSLGKRQALGKSLLQLRRSAASRTEHVSTNAR